MSGAELLCRTLARLGVDVVFGVPGTQTIDLWEALRRNGAPAVVGATSELQCAFMANGYARATGRTGVVLTIPGPGFTYALPGLAEALLDSAPLLLVTGAPAVRADGGYALQAIRQAEIAAPLTKAVFEVTIAEELEQAVADAFALTQAGEPGPVLLQVSEGVLAARATARDEADGENAVAPVDAAPALTMLANAERPLVLAGQGAAGAAEQVLELVELLGAPILTTTSGRGVVSERHPLCLPFDSPGAATGALTELVSSADVVLVLGAKLSHNATHGGALELPQEKLVRVDASAEVLKRAYPAAVSVEADVGSFVRQVLPGLRAATGWTESEIARRREQLQAAAHAVGDPTLAGREPGEAFAALRRQLPEPGVVATDSGLHQYLARRHFEVLRPRTLLVPTDFQSMGFGLPAAIGAAVGTGGPAVAIVGDGGFAIGSTELATAVHHGLPVVVVVLVDGAFGLIRRQQLRRTGHESGVVLPLLDVNALARAAGATHVRAEAATCEEVVAEALAAGSVTVIEIAMDDGRNAAANRRLGAARATARSLLGPGAERLASALRRR